MTGELKSLGIIKKRAAVEGCSFDKIFFSL